MARETIGEATFVNHIREQIGVSGVSFSSYSSRQSDDTQELKKALQSIVMDECGDLFQHYNFRLVKLLAQRNENIDGYSFAVGVMSPNVEGGNTLLVRQSMSRMDIFSDPSFSYQQNSLSIAGSFFIQHAFHVLARTLRDEIEKRTKEMPVMANNPFSPFSNSAYTTSLTSASIISQMQQVRVNEDDITSFCNPIKKVSKFEHIDKLIADAKKRLYGGYSHPVLSFQYF